MTPSEQLTYPLSQCETISCHFYGLWFNKYYEVISKIPNFALELAVYQKFREYSQEKCQEYGPSSGQCLWQDQGCAQECFNKIDYHSFTALMATVLPKTSELAAYLKIRSV